MPASNTPLVRRALNAIDAGHVYVVSLASQAHRFEAMAAELVDAGIRKFQRFEAVNGAEAVRDPRLPLSPRARFDMGRSCGDTRLIITPGAVGCLLSHMAIYRKVVESGLDGAMIFEDDAMLRFGDATLPFIERFADEDCGPRAGVLLLGYVAQFEEKSDANTDANTDADAGEATGRLRRFKELHMGTHAYYVTAEAAASLLRHMAPIDLQIDALIGVVARADGWDVVAFEPSLVEQLENRDDYKSTVQDYETRAKAPYWSVYYKF